MNSIITILTQSMFLAIMGIGVYITYKILDFPDMTADGSYTLGAAITASMVASGAPAILAVLVSIIGGAIAGMVSGLLHVKLKITNLLSGILVMGMLYSINLRIMKGKANTPIFNSKHLLNSEILSSIDSRISILLIAFIIVLLVKLILDLFLKTGLGYLIRGTGDNEQMVKTLGIDVSKIKVIALMISNSFIALSGSMMSQFLGFADVNMGIGTLVLGIASIIIGLSVFSGLKKIKDTTKIIIGTIIYQFAVFFALNTGLQSSDLKLVTGLIIIAFISLSKNGLGKKTKISFPKLSKRESVVSVINQDENLSA
ncbi:ABC transporter permease [Peptostreptococcus russellii]|uniref:Putative ABC transport system permease protein n=1 Tax=Peptostreptococcus russellii TaxID=215200 RepID=A0A1H8J9C8_9FIRM|nr:ABC transporter permease [Peptostreptococcus russellii]MBC2576984.1 ABC transporter permease [Peptostreptococcus russellii]SEN77533.1 putative ABC transport system permease protein [Peptostreptococcus russellii]